MASRKLNFSLDLQQGGVSKETTARLGSATRSSGADLGGQMAADLRSEYRGVPASVRNRPARGAGGFLSDLDRSMDAIPLLGPVSNLLAEDVNVAATNPTQFTRGERDLPVIGTAVGAGENIVKTASHLATNPTQIARSAGWVQRQVRENPGVLAEWGRKGAVSFVKSQLEPENILLNVALMGGGAVLGKSGSALESATAASGAETAAAGAEAAAVTTGRAAGREIFEQVAQTPQRIRTKITGSPETVLQRVRGRAANRFFPNPKSGPGLYAKETLAGSPLPPAAGPWQHFRESRWRAGQTASALNAPAKYQTAAEVVRTINDPTRILKNPAVRDKALELGTEVAAAEKVQDAIQDAQQLKNLDLPKDVPEDLNLKKKKSEEEENQQQRRPTEQAEEGAPMAFQFAAPRTSYTAGRGMRPPASDPYEQPEAETVSAWPTVSKGQSRQPRGRGGRSPYRSITPETPFGEAMRQLGGGRRGLPGGPVWEGQTALGGVGLEHDWRTLDKMTVPRGSGEWDLAGRGLGRAAVASVTDKFRNRSREQQSAVTGGESVPYHGAGMGNVDMGASFENVKTVPAAVDMGSPIEKVTPVRPTGARTGALAKIHNELNVPPNPRFSETAAGR